MEDAVVDAVADLGGWNDMPGHDDTGTPLNAGAVGVAAVELGVPGSKWRRSRSAGILVGHRTGDKVDRGHTDPNTTGTRHSGFRRQHGCGGMGRWLRLPYTRLAMLPYAKMFIGNKMLMNQSWCRS